MTFSGSKDRKGQRLDALPPAAIRLVVAGSRKYNNYAEFCRYLQLYLKDHGWDQTSDLVFISGKARHGPDNMVIEFCKEFGYDWVEYPAQWQREDGSKDMGAGYRRNLEMANVANYALLLRVSDGMSNGTDHMYKACVRRFKQKEMVEHPFLILVESDPPPVYEDLFWS